MMSSLKHHLFGGCSRVPRLMTGGYVQRFNDETPRPRGTEKSAVKFPDCLLVKCGLLNDIWGGS